MPSPSPVQQPVPHRPGQETLRANLLKAMDESGLTQSQLARKMGLTKDKVSKIFSGARSLTIEDANKAAAATQWTLNQLLGIDPPPDAHRSWDPVLHEPAELLRVWATHQSGCNEIIGFDHHVVCSATTTAVHEKRDVELFKTLTWTPEGLETLHKYGNFAAQRRARYQASTAQTAPRILSLMFKSSFERLVYRQFPYQACTSSEVLESLLYLRDECVVKRGFRLVLLDDKVGRDEELADYLAAFEDLVVVGRTLVVERRSRDFVIKHSSNPTAVQQGLTRLRRLVEQAGHDMDADVPKAVVLDLLDRYIGQAKVAPSRKCRLSRK